MNVNVARQIVVTTLQNALIGQLKPYTNVTPQCLTDAILAKVDFSKPYSEIESEKLITTIIDIIKNLDDEMRIELNNLKGEEKLLANFIHGKLTAYAEIIELIKSL